MEITLVGIGLLIGLVLSWIMGLSGGDVFIWIFCLYFGLQVGQLIFTEDSNDDDDDFGGGILTPAFQGNWFITSPPSTYFLCNCFWNFDNSS